ncbi:MAG: serine protease [Clostridiaceae bacterium]|jgi:hypothetical protein|nr:serine protease [Clostridiaceae bacterium]
MDFYVISQDVRVFDSVEPIKVHQAFDMETIRRGRFQELDDWPVQLYIKEKETNSYVDFIEKPIPLISDKLKQVFEMYEKDIFYKPVMLADVKKMKQNLYWLCIPKDIEALSCQSEFKMDGSLKKLVISEKKVNFRKIFRITGIIEYIVILNQDVAESILRRDFYGITLKKIDKE